MTSLEALRARAWQARRWISQRWDGPDRLAAVVNKPLPRNVSWLHTLGSLLLLYLAFQALTGILLGVYYNPSPEHAYRSIEYVREELFLGRFLHHLHRYGAGFVLVTAFLHLARSYFLAAYKPPRELLWVSGVVLFVLLTLFAFTGQLLPYDQRGYWATVVGIEIVASPPGLGPWVRRLLTGGYGDIGAVTLSRFYILHICVLPLLLFGLIAMHLGILQKVGAAGPLAPYDEGEPKQRFYPSQAFRDVLVSAAGALALCLVAAFVASRDTGPADPAARGFTPRPEWYFYAHYQLLRLLPGAWQILGTFVLPNLLLIALVLLPFLDRRPERRLVRRKALSAIGGLFCLALVGLTAFGIAEAEPRGTGTEPVAADPLERGRTLFDEKGCHQCHTIHGEGGETGPNLSWVGQRLKVDYMRAWIERPTRFRPETEMPAFEGTQDELDAIVRYLSSLDKEQEP